MAKKAKVAIFCSLVITVVVLDFLLCNVHISRLYVQHQADLYPANITISNTCSWAAGNHTFDFKDYRPDSFVLIARMLSITYEQYGIMTVIRDGSFLHTVRMISADMDMDIYIIVPKTVTFWDAYTKIRSVINTHEEFRNITLETQNIVLAGIFFDKSDAIRISFNGKKIVDVNVLHETFLNDPELQSPCLKQMDCRDFVDNNDEYIAANSKHLTTKNLFESLCECNYMGSKLLCFNMHGTKYLEIRYGLNYTQKIKGAKRYSLIYERPNKAWRKVISTFPKLLEIKKTFEGHTDEHNSFNNKTLNSTTSINPSVLVESTSIHP